MTIPLGTDAVTAYRLAVQEDGIVPISRMMAAWNVIDLPRRHGPDDLPPDMRREGDRVVSDTAYEPLHLSLDDIVRETFRLAAVHRAPDSEGWQNASHTARVGNGLGVDAAMKRAGIAGGYTGYLRRHVMIEERLRGDTVFLRPTTRGLIESLAPVVTEVTCPGDLDPRVLAEQATFGAAYRALWAMPRDLVAEGTHVRFHRGDDERVARFDAMDRRWTMADGKPLPRRDASDPVIHTYRNGHLVHATIGFVSRSKTGRIFANVGTPIDSPGDHDAFVSRLDQKEAADPAEALELLRSRGDLDHVFTGVHDHDGMMGYWLVPMKD
jgi:hypothetical protein